MTIDGWLRKKFYESNIDDIEAQMPKDKKSKRYKILKFIQKEFKRRINYAVALNKLERSR
jgi:hypothetical protein